MKKVAINGLGRIGRATFKIITDEAKDLQLVGVNDLIPEDNLAYLLQYDTVYRKWNRRVGSEAGHLVVDGDLVGILSWYDNEWGDSHQMVRCALALEL
jgi:glyceraldehyde 3-phosphate dehydrogenase